MRSEGYSEPSSARSVDLAFMRGVEEACEADDFVAEALAHIVEGEVVPRLRQLHQPTVQADPAIRRPTSAETDRFHNLLLSIGPVNLEEEVAGLLGSGMAIDVLLLDLLVPAARHLGFLWEQDLCDFLAVTTGLGRLQVITNRLFENTEETDPRGDRSILLVPSPGETHIYALTIVARFFRKAGWNVTIGARAQPDATELLQQTWFDAVGLSLSCDVCLPELKETVGALRRASRNPALAVVVGGPWVARNRDKPQDVDADICATDGQSAPHLTEALLDARVGRSSVDDGRCLGGDQPS